RGVRGEQGRQAQPGAPEAEADATAKILVNQSLSDATYLPVHCYLSNGCVVVHAAKFWRKSSGDNTLAATASFTRFGSSGHFATLLLLMSGPPASQPPLENKPIEDRWSFQIHCVLSECTRISRRRSRSMQGIVIAGGRCTVCFWMSGHDHIARHQVSCAVNFQPWDIARSASIGLMAATPILRSSCRPRWQAARGRKASSRAMRHKASF